MDYLSLIVTFIGGIGIGTVISTLIGNVSSNNRMLFDLKLIKYCNLIQSYRNAVIAKSDEKSRQKYVSCHQQLKLIAPDDIIKTSEKLFTSNDSLTIQNELVDLMRSDLQKYISNKRIKIL